jgi:hypothetical protein
MDDLEGNLCAICARRVFGRTGRVPNYYCAGCLSAHREAIESKEPWVYQLYRWEHSRRSRRTRAYKRGVPVMVSVEALVALNRL